MHEREECHVFDTSHPRYLVFFHYSSAGEQLERNRESFELQIGESFTASY